MKLIDSIALVTGAGTSIGRATAVRLARQGVRLALTGRRREPLEATRRLVAAEKSEAIAIPGDVTADAWRQQAIDTVREHFGRLDILVNNAGVVSAGTLENIEADDIRQQIEINLLAPILLVRSALPLLRQRPRAAIVNVESSIALVGMPFYSPYAAAKGGLAHFDEALRRELSDTDIRVMSVFPVATDTPMMVTAGGGADSPEAVAEALVAGLQNDAIEVLRGGQEFADLVALNRRDPRAADQRVEGRKAAMRERASGHRSM